MLDIALTIVLSLVFLAALQLALGGELLAGFAEGARLLFLFMDIGLGVWVLLLLIVGLARRELSVGRVVGFAALGAAVNLLTVIVVGFVQGGTAPWAFILFAVEAGIAFLAAATIVTLIVHRRLVKPPAGAESAT